MVVGAAIDNSISGRRAKRGRSLASSDEGGVGTAAYDGGFDREEGGMERGSHVGSNGGDGEAVGGPEHDHVGGDLRLPNESTE